MRRRSFLVGLLAVAVVVAGISAEARMHAPYRGHRIIPSGVAPPLDGFTAPRGAYSFRKLISAYAGPAVRLRRASDNAELDINFLGCTAFTGCPWDAAAATAHCAATTCFLTTWYSQSGVSKDLVQTTAANQPALVFNCQNSLPCARITSTSQSMLVTATYTPTTGVMSLNKVMRRSAGASNCNFRTNGTNSTILGTVGAPFALSNSGGTVSATADANWHSLIGIANTATSSLNVDGVATTGTTGNVVAAGNTQMFGITGTTCDVGELAYWDAYVLTAGEIAALTANQRSFWGF